MEVGEEEGEGASLPGNGAWGSGGGESEHEGLDEGGPPPPTANDEDSRPGGDPENPGVGQDVLHLSHLPVQSYVPYATTQLDTYAGPSGELIFVSLPALILVAPG